MSLITNDLGEFVDDYDAYPRITLKNAGHVPRAKTYAKRCAECGRGFVTHAERQRHCSRECSERAERRYAEAARKRRHGRGKAKR